MSIFDDIDKQCHTDSVQLAMALQKKCASVGFDWPSAEPVFDKVLEEVEEIKEAINNPNKHMGDVEEELGDLLFACINLSRHLNIEPEQCLAKANEKFSLRFQSIEKQVKAQNKVLNELSAESYEQLWLQAKITNN